MSLARELAAFDPLEGDAPAGGRRMASRLDSGNRRSNNAAVEVSTARETERILALYRDRYFDFNVRRFYEKITAQHGVTLSSRLERCSAYILLRAFQAHDTRKPERSHCLIYWPGL